MTSTLPPVRVTLPAGRLIDVPFGTRIGDLFEQDTAEPPLAAIRNGATVELSTPLVEACNVTPVRLTDRTGYAVYARSLCFLLALATREVLPEATVVIRHSINNEIFGVIEPAVSPAQIQMIRDHMRDLVALGEPIERLRVKREEAVRIFTSYGADDKLRLLRRANHQYVSIYRCRGYDDYLYGALVPSLGYLTRFDLVPFDGGFLILLPEKKAPHDVTPVAAIPKLRAVFAETEEWARILEVAHVGAINEALAIDDGQELILMAEALQERKLSLIADAIVRHSTRRPLVLIAGPSSSGKTTFSRRLSIQLRVLGLNPYTISADDYYVDRERNPRHPDGSYDFEALAAIDTDLLGQHLTALLDGDPIDLVRFDFVSGKRVPTGQSYAMADDSILIIEGIHGLNDGLTPQIPADRKYKIYVSALTPLNIDRHSAVYVSDVRTLRRIIRDHRSRGKSAETTLVGWPSVREGEERYIFPHQEQADVMFNSSLLYEINVLKPYAEPLLEQVDRDSPVFAEANRMLKLLRFFRPTWDTYVPANSIIREFIGDSCFE